VKHRILIVEDNPLTSELRRDRLEVVFLNAADTENQSAWVLLARGLILNSLTVFVLIRLGFLALVASVIFHLCLLENFPLTTQGSTWYAGLGLAGILLMGAMAFYGFYTSLGGRPVFGGALLAE
jgi:hypothetical protein